MRRNTKAGARLGVCLDGIINTICALRLNAQRSADGTAPAPPHRQLIATSAPPPHRLGNRLATASDRAAAMLDWALQQHLQPKVCRVALVRSLLLPGQRAAGPHDGGASCDSV
ncbi:hypothetical protein AWZ03_000307 [Drosophila navojoa]|uniref:Uncharacterized protein n=1 Tax=Drosophila navojoa TaxID=7232 RepID=A0A484C1T5_DRONA|nr:hypothetical protein AWZ03_000307 [Drosophila navojoa]